ncbi:hypothetical protein BN3590_00046 [Clostridium sp. C105KSO15]|nr:hypothetical protein BN3590_00046 [Clostridium sp. C105KSO15]
MRTLFYIRGVLKYYERLKKRKAAFAMTRKKKELKPNELLTQAAANGFYTAEIERILKFPDNEVDEM